MAVLDADAKGADVGKVVDGDAHPAAGEGLEDGCGIRESVLRNEGLSRNSAGRGQDHLKRERDTVRKRDVEDVADGYACRRDNAGTILAREVVLVRLGARANRERKCGKRREYRFSAHGE